MHLTAYWVDRNIPPVALYLMLRSQSEANRPQTVGAARGFAKDHPDRGIRAEEAIRRYYGVSSQILTQLDRRYEKLSKEQKQTVAWQAAAELFAAGDGKRVLRLF